MIGLLLNDVGGTEVNEKLFSKFGARDDVWYGKDDGSCNNWNGLLNIIGFKDDGPAPT